MPLTKLGDLIELIKENPKKRLVVTFAQEENTIRACRDACELGFAEVTLVGDEEMIKSICLENKIDPSIFEIINETDDILAAKKSISLMQSGYGHVLMKGLISTDKMLRCILDKEDGLMIPGALLTHISIADIPNHRKLLLFTDAAFIPRPNIDQKIDMTRYIIDTARKIGINRPKVAIISFSEKANHKIKEAVDGLIISKMGEQGLIKNADIDGPLAIDLAIDSESVRTKGVKSCVNGDADCLVFPFLEVGNVFFKSLTYFAKAEIATYIVGTQVPIVISSRVDTEKSKLYSIAFNCFMCEKGFL
jgi:phosphate butyryltransferase